MIRRCTASGRQVRAALGLATGTLLLAFGTAAVATETGDLRIVSQPAVEVIWEGFPLGETDAAGVLEIAGIPPGAYRVVLRKAGHEPRSETLEVAPGLSVLTLPLTPSAPPPAPLEPPRAATPAEPQQLPSPSAADPQPEPAPGDISKPPAEPAPVETPPVETPPPPHPEPPGEMRPLPSADDSAAEAAGRRRWPLMAALGVLAGVLAIFALRRSWSGSIASESVAPDPARQPPPVERPMPKSIGGADLGALREEVRRRERDLEKARPARRRPQQEVIDVDDFEIIEDNK